MGPEHLLAVSSTELTIRMVVGLAVVGLLLLVLTRLTRRFMEGRGGHRPAIVIRHQQRLDKHASVTLLTAGDRNLLVGTAGQSIVLLAEGDDLGVAAQTTDPGDATTGAVTGGSADEATGSGATIDVRSTGWAHPIRALQNLTVRRG